LGAIWIFLSSNKLGSTNDFMMEIPKAGFLSPDFELDTLDGEKIKLSDLRGKPIIINFWASWCQPCRTEMPAIQKALLMHAQDDLVILAVNLTNQDDEIKVRNFISELQLTFTVLMDRNGDTGNLYRVSALPTTFFVRPDGVIEEVVIGGPMAEALLLTRIQKLLASR